MTRAKKPDLNSAPARTPGRETVARGRRQRGLPKAAQTINIKQDPWGSDDVSLSAPKSQRARTMTLKSSSKNKKGRRPNGRGCHSEPAASAGEYKVGPGRPPRQFRWKPGQSGNPKGAKPKPLSIVPDLKSLLERELNKKVTFKQGEKERILSKAALGIEQLVNQFAKGDRHARRDLFYLADKLGIDLFGGQRKMIQEALAPHRQAILDGYVKRRGAVEDRSSDPSSVIAPADLLDDDNEN